MGVKYAIEKAGGKRTTSLTKWFKDFAFNVLLQTVHALIYVIYMSIALSVSQDNLGGFLICLIILNFMLNADKIIIKIFGLNKAGTIGDVNKNESILGIAAKFYPIVTIYGTVFNSAKNLVLGKRSLGRELIYSIQGYDNYKDADKAYDKTKFESIVKIEAMKDKLFGKSEILQWFKKFGNQLGIEDYSELYKALSKDVSLETKRQIYNDIQKIKKANKQHFTRKIKFTKDVALGLGGVVASVAVGISDPMAGVTMFMKSKKTIDKYKKPSKQEHKKYKVSTDKAKMKANEANRKYEAALETYTNNQYEYEEALKKETDAQKKKELKDKRKIEEAKEMDELRKAYENKYKTETEYKMAKHRNDTAVNVVSKMTGLSGIAEIAEGENIMAQKEKDKLSKQGKRVSDVSKAVEKEEELRKEIKKLHEAYRKAYGDDNATDNATLQANKEKAEEAFIKDINSTYKVAKQANISSVQIRNAVNQYMSENHVDSVNSDNVDKVLDKLQENLNKNKKSKVKITEDIKKQVKDKLQEQMIKEKRGLGYDEKDATANLRGILGTLDVAPGNIKINKNIKENYKTSSGESVKDIHENIRKLLTEINTMNGVAQVKHGGSLINIGKGFEDAKK